MFANKLDYEFDESVSSRSVAVDEIRVVFSCPAYNLHRKRYINYLIFNTWLDMFWNLNLLIKISNSKNYTIYPLNTSLFIS